MLLAASLVSMSKASVESGQSRVRSVTALVARGFPIRRLPVRESKFATLDHPTVRLSCEVSQQPDALATPNPPLDLIGETERVIVSFVIGTDGRVYSPLILQSGGSSRDRSVLDTVRAWRYRPALCNGVPTESEGKIQFSGR